MQDAQQAFLQLRRRYPDSAFGYKLLGMAYDAEQQYDEAVKEFETALRANPAMPEIAFAIRFMHWKRRDYGPASEWLKKELALDPCDARSHY